MRGLTVAVKFNFLSTSCMFLFKPNLLLQLINQLHPIANYAKLFKNKKEQKHAPIYQSAYP